MTSFEQDMNLLAETLLISPRTGLRLTISSEPECQTDGSYRFTVTGAHGERWGIVFGMTELTP